MFKTLKIITGCNPDKEINSLIKNVLQNIAHLYFAIKHVAVVSEADLSTL